MRNLKFIVLMAVSIFAISCASDSPKEEVKENNEVLVDHAMYPKWSATSNIYEVNIRQFTEEGTFAAFDMNLERLAGMGVDILWFMPISPIGEKNRKEGLGSYYSVRDYTAINPEFGTYDDFRAVVEHAHSLGMHVIIDWVANHTAWDHEWVTAHPEYYKMKDGVMIAPFDWTDVVQLNYDNKNLRAAMTQEMEFWVDSFNIDGFRCDVASMVPTDFWDSTRAVLNQKKDIFMLAEAEEPALNKHAFESSYGWAMHHKMAAVAKGEDKAQVLMTQVTDDLEKFGKSTYLMQFTTNHDENSWNGTEFEKMGDAYHIMSALTYVVPGMPLIYNGQESKNEKRLLFFDKDQINWKDYELIDYYQSMIELKNKNKALWNGAYGGDFNVLKTDNESVLAFSRKLDYNTVIFIGNFSANSIEATVTMEAQEGKYLNHLNREIIELKGDYKLKLKAWDFVILVK